MMHHNPGRRYEVPISHLYLLMPKRDAVRDREIARHGLPER